jgi:hypothetical protein
VRTVTPAAVASNDDGNVNEQFAIGVYDASGNLSGIIIYDSYGDARTMQINSQGEMHQTGVGTCDASGCNITEIVAPGADGNDPGAQWAYDPTAGTFSSYGTQNEYREWYDQW